MVNRCSETNKGYSNFEGTKLLLENWALLGVKEFQKGLWKLGKKEIIGNV